jgi:Acyltransferase family.
MLIIALGHFKSCEGLVVQGFSPVEFFFILSGFLIYKSAQKHPQLSVLEYTGNKVKRFFPKYFTALVLCTIIHFVSYRHNGLTEDLFSFSQCFISEALFLQAIGFLQSNINYPCWYLSVLVIGGAFVFAVIKYNSRLATNIVLPCIVLFSYTLLFTRYDTIEQWGSIGIISLPLLRGISGMSLGAILSSIETESICPPKEKVLAGYRGCRILYCLELFHFHWENPIPIGRAVL